MGTAAIETSALECPTNASQSEQFPEGAKVEVEIFIVEAKQLSEQCHLLAELKERDSQSFDLVIGQRARLDTADRLSLQKLADQLDEGEHQLSQAIADVVGADRHAQSSGHWSSKGIRDGVEGIGCGGHGPEGLHCSESPSDGGSWRNLARRAVSTEAKSTCTFGY